MFENPVAAIMFWSILSLVILFIVGIVIHQYRHVIWGGYMRVSFTGEDKRTGGIIIKADVSDHDFEIKLFGKFQKYTIDRNRIYHSGKFRIPTAYYKMGDPVPLDMLRENIDSEITAIDYAQVARNTVTRDLLRAFDTTFLSVQNVFIMTILVIAAGFLLLGFWTNTKFDKLNALHSAPTITINTPTDEGFQNNNGLNTLPPVLTQ